MSKYCPPIPGANQVRPSRRGPRGPRGYPGASAYEIYVACGGTLSECEWVDSLEGPQGPPGEDGQDGQDGQDGEQGPPAYVVSASTPETTDVIWIDTSGG